MNESKIHEHEPVLCGFVFCQAPHRLSAWEVNLKEEDRNEIERILLKYETEGCSVVNAFDLQLKDCFSTF